MNEKIIGHRPPKNDQLVGNIETYSIKSLLHADLDALFLRPDLLEKPSAWVGHIPFAHWIIKVSRPRLLVELGTHAGVSYSAFCAAVAKEDTQTECFAVDTWTGDEHAGWYGNQIYDDLKTFNEQHYYRFSTLLKCTFDDALSSFEDKSIDILHIDGFHTYEAVSHDFTTWQSKLSDKAVVLFHDTNEHRKDFGVWKFWAEISQKYPSFEFLHSHGLGVLAYGQHAPSAIMELCSLKNEKEKTSIRERFNTFGSLWSIEANAIKDKAVLAKEKAKMLKDIAILTEKNTTNDEHIKKLKIDAEKQIKERKQEIRNLILQSTARLEQARIEMKQTLSHLEQKNLLLNKLIAEKEHQLLQCQIDKNSILSSRSWRITQPFRMLVQMVRKPMKNQKAKLVKIAKLFKSSKFEKKTIYKTLNNSQLFDKNRYLANYPDVAAAALDPVNHYIENGADERRNPSDKFDTNFYLEKYSDVAVSGVNPLYHYLRYGQQEGRQPIPCEQVSELVSTTNQPFFDKSWYVKQYPEYISSDFDPFSHYLKNQHTSHYLPSAYYAADPSRLQSIPEPYRYRVTTSPILAGVPPVNYLAAFRGRGITAAHKPATLDDFNRMSVINMDTICGPLLDSDLRLIATLDFQRRLLVKKYQHLPQVELISVVLPTRNRGHLIMDAICSLIMQSYDNWELIVSDDNSSDATEEVVKSFNDSRIVYLHNEEPVGTSEARNRALKIARGSVIAYLDDDDLWDPHFLLISLNHMREAGRKMIYSAQMVWNGFDETTRVGEKFHCIRFNKFNRSLLEHINYISMITSMHDKELAEEISYFDNNLTRLVDWDFFLRMTELTSPIALPCILSHYFRGRDQQSVTNSNPLQKNYRKIIDKIAYSGAIVLPNSKDAYGFHGISTSISKQRSQKLSSLPIPSEITIIIPNYEAVDHLERCLESIEAHTSLPYSVLIIDNNSSAETRTRLDQIANRFLSTRWLPCDSHQGFTYAVNQGLRELESRHDYVMILNNDTVVTPNWLEELYYVLIKYQDVAMAVPRHVLITSNQVTRAHVPCASQEAEVDINLSAHHKNILDPDFSPEDELIEVTFAPLFCGLLRKADLDEIGYLDELNGPHYRSDWILSLTLRSSLKKRIVYTPFSKVYHDQGVSSTIERTQRSLNKPAA